MMQEVKHGQLVEALGPDESDAETEIVANADNRQLSSAQASAAAAAPQSEVTRSDPGVIQAALARVKFQINGLDTDEEPSDHVRTRLGKLYDLEVALERKLRIVTEPG